MSEEHIAVLSKHCRVCGSRFKAKKAKKSRQDHRYSCSDKRVDLLEVFGIDINEDKDEIHPQSYCHPCSNIIYHTKAAKDKTEYNPRKVIETWSPHTDNCLVCSSDSIHSVGGRPSKRVYKPGRPAKGSFQSAITHIQAIAPLSFCQKETVVAPHDFFKCPLCLEILDRPIELKVCDTLVCADCLCTRLQVSQSTSCPCCYTEHLSNLDTIQPPSKITLKALETVEVTCSECAKRGYLKHHKAHVDSMCGTSYFTPVPLELDPSDLLNKPECMSLSPFEEKLQSKLIKRSMHSSQTLKVKTGGTPLTFVQVSSPRVSSGSASQTTLKRRSTELLRVSGGDDVLQMTNEVKTARKEDREKLIEELKKTTDCFQVQFSVEQSLGLQSVLTIPFYKLRIMKKMLGPNVKIASEKKMRAEGNSLAGVDNLKSELVPFTFPLRDGRHTVEIKNVPMCYTPNLWEKVENMLNFNNDIERRVHRLTWHNGMIPDSEIWVKLGGDKGGGSFKMNFQICNVDHPNSPVNTCAFCVFEAPDNATNLKIALQRFQDEVDSMNTKTWRGKSIRVFFSGDYEFLCNMYGLSGASGRHCCLWCLISSDQLRTPPTTVESRSTDSIVRDNQQFIAAGGKLNKVKNYNNCVREPFFKQIPLNQVCPPGLHIGLGIFYRLFQLMEDQCHQLDLIVVGEVDSREKGGPSYSNFMDDYAKARTLKEELDRANEEIALLNDLVGLLVVFGPSEEGEEENDPQLQDLRSELEEKALHVNKLDTEWAKLDALTSAGFKREDGPFVKAIDIALEAFNVRRQSYYSGTFVGNHVDRTLEPKNIVDLCNAVVLAAGNYEPAIMEKAEKIQRTFSVVLDLFSKCHNIYSKCMITEEEIASLDLHIKSFMTFYREQFPHATVIPKMHILEKHVVDWLNEWKVGLGLMGEQGAESIHAYFNNLKGSYRNIANGVDRLRCMMRTHFIHIAPSTITCRPSVKRRKRNL